MDANQKMGIFFGVSERPTKLLLNDYFSAFRTDNILNQAEKLQVSSKRIPVNYTSYGDMVTILNELTTDILQHDSLLKVPPKSADMEIFDSLTNQKYLIKLDLVPFNIIWDESLFDPFRDQVNAVKKQIGDMISMVPFVFDCLKQQNKDLLSTITLKIETGNLTIRVVDSRFPQYNHAKRISFIIEKVLQ